jgi:hypothetical protein
MDCDQTKGFDSAFKKASAMYEITIQIISPKKTIADAFNVFFILNYFYFFVF